MVIIKQVIAYSSENWLGHLAASTAWRGSNTFSGFRFWYRNMSKSWKWTWEESKNESDGWKRKAGRW